MKNFKINFRNQTSDLIALFEKFNNYYSVCNYLHDTSEPLIVDDPNGIPVYHYSEFRKNTPIKNSTVLIDMFPEGVYVEEETFENYDKSNQYIFFANGGWDKNYYDWGFDYEVVPYNLVLEQQTMFKGNRYKKSGWFNQRYDFEYPKPYMFVSTNGMKEPNRDILIKKLHKDIEYKNYVLKSAGENLGVDIDYLDVWKPNKDNLSGYNAIQGLDVSASYLVPIDMYNSAYFNVALETGVNYPNSFVATEKTYKPMFSGMPFVVFNAPRFLENLHKQGFQTYGDLWDESYDLEYDIDKRADKIVKLCQELENFDWTGNKDKLESIAKHNGNRLLHCYEIHIEQIKYMKKILHQLV
jgi:hypothetical protein